MSHFISLAEAVSLTTEYRDNRGNMLNPDYGTDTLPFSETFDRSAFESLLEHQDCSSIRVYLGMDEEKLIRLVIVGVDSSGNDILPTSDEDLIVETGVRCPDLCTSSPLYP